MNFLPMKKITQVTERKVKLSADEKILLIEALKHRLNAEMVDNFRLNDGGLKDFERAMIEKMFERFLVQETLALNPYAKMNYKCRCCALKAGIAIVQKSDSCRC